MNTISDQIKKQLPKFVTDNYPVFIEFLKSYYSWMETKGNPQYIMGRLRDARTIDQSLNDHTQYLLNELLAQVPVRVLGDPSLFAKHVKEFYESKGSEDSFRFLFRVLFDQDIELYYPKTNVLILSGGKWTQPVSVKVEAITGQPFEFADKTVKLYRKNTLSLDFDDQIYLANQERMTTHYDEVLIDRVESYEFGGKTYYELYISAETLSSNSDIRAGDLVIYENVDPITSLDYSIRGLVTQTTSTVKVVSKGTGFKQNEYIEVSNGFAGAGTVMRVIAIDGTGGIEDVEITKYGLGYNSPTGILRFQYKTATFDLTMGAMCKYRGFYVDQSSLLLSKNRLQDSYYYQDFSYVIKAGMGIERWGETIKKLVHPVGMIMFSQLFLLEELKINIASKFGVSFTWEKWFLDTELVQQVDDISLWQNKSFFDLQAQTDDTSFTVSKSWFDLQAQTDDTAMYVNKSWFDLQEQTDDTLLTVGKVWFDSQEQTDDTSLSVQPFYDDTPSLSEFDSKEIYPNYSDSQGMSDTSFSQIQPFYSDSTTTSETSNSGFDKNFPPPYLLYSDYFAEDYMVNNQDYAVTITLIGIIQPVQETISISLNGAVVFSETTSTAQA